MIASRYYRIQQHPLFCTGSKISATATSTSSCSYGEVQRTPADAPDPVRTDGTRISREDEPDPKKFCAVWKLVPFLGTSSREINSAGRQEAVYALSRFVQGVRIATTCMRIVSGLAPSLVCIAVRYIHRSHCVCSKELSSLLEYSMQAFMQAFSE